jgi:hypothetical protein
VAGPLSIQRLPKGLLDWLGMKGSGETPTQLAATVAAVNDIGELYLLDRLGQANSATIAIPTVGTFQGTASGNTVVPDLTIWLVKSISITTGTLPAGTSYTARPGYQRKQSNVYLAPNNQNAAAAGERIAEGWYFEKPLILLPGDQPIVSVERIVVGTAQAFFIWVDFYALSI